MNLLPPELVDKTLDFIYDDFPALFACSHVCKAWLPTSRYHLWGTRTLDLGGGLNRKNDRIVQLLSDPLSTLALGVRQVNIDSISQPRDFLLLMSRIAPCRSVLQVTRSLYLKKMIWKDIDEASRTSFISSFDSLTELTFSNIKFGSFGDMASLLVSFPNLESLSFIRVGWSSTLPSLGSPSLQLNLPHLRTLDIDGGSQDVVEWLRLGKNTFSHLENARFKLSDVPPSCETLLVDFAPSLERIEIAFYRLRFDRFQSLNIDLCRNTTLRSIHITHIQLGSAEYPFPNVGWVSRALASVTSPFIHTIRFAIWINDAKNINQIDWESLKANFNRPQFG
ncbi:hypothetical protein C8J57DRAFT_1466845, partial [Mycena rebaudengoi]